MRRGSLDDERHCRMLTEPSDSVASAGRRRWRDASPVRRSSQTRSDPISYALAGRLPLGEGPVHDRPFDLERDRRVDAVIGLRDRARAGADVGGALDPHTDRSPDDVVADVHSGRVRDLEAEGVSVEDVVLEYPAGEVR